MNDLRPRSEVTIENILRAMGLDKDVDLRKTILKKLCDKLKEEKTESAKSFQSLIQTVKVDGYRKGKAPTKALINLLSNIIHWRNEKVFSTILDFWIELNQHRINQADDFYQNIESDKCDVIQRELMQGEHSQYFSDLVKEFKAQFECSNDEPADMFLCIASFFEHSDEDDSLDPPDEINLHDQIVLPDFWNTVLQKLNDLPLNSDEWDTFDDFVHATNNLRQEKDQQPDINYS